MVLYGKPFFTGCDNECEFFLESCEVHFSCSTSINREESGRERLDLLSIVTRERERAPGFVEQAKLPFLDLDNW